MYRFLARNNCKFLCVLLLLILVLKLIFNDEKDTVVVEEVLQGTTKDFKESQATSRGATLSNFCVLNRKCQIPRIDPFSADVMAIWKPPPLQSCTTDKHLFSVRYDGANQLYVLHFHKRRFSELFPEILSYACVRYEVVGGPTNAAKWKKSPPSGCADWLVPRHVEGIFVECIEQRNGTRVLQRDAFAFVQQPARPARADEDRSRSHPTIIMLGIDSMSQMNFQRAMTRTASFVRQPGWHEMLGYTKIGHDAFADLLALLSGLTPKQWAPFCDVEKPGCLDAITYLWNHFHNSGYLTAYADDSSTLPFTRRPVDYYLSPILKAFGEIMQAEPGSTCLGRRHRFRYVLDYSLQLLERFVEAKPAKPLFGLLWTSSFSHADFRGAASVDADFVDYLRQCEERGLFERAIVVLFSVNGQQEGPLMELKTSFFEERLPMLHVYLPPWYREKYPAVVEALQANGRRLFSTYDLHISMKDLLLQVLPNLSFEKLCHNCYSMLSELPDERDCEEAAIPELWCPCQPLMRVPNTEQVQLLARIVVFRMNAYLSSRSQRALCPSLQLERLLAADCRVTYDDQGQELPLAGGISSYYLKFVTRPRAVFRALIFSNEATSYAEVPLRKLVRLDGHPSCVDEPVANTLCVCRPTL